MIYEEAAPTDAFCLTDYVRILVGRRWDGGTHSSESEQSKVQEQATKSGFNRIPNPGGMDLLCQFMPTSCTMYRNPSFRWTSFN